MSAAEKPRYSAACSALLRTNSFSKMGQALLDATKTNQSIGKWRFRAECGSTVVVTIREPKSKKNAKTAKVGGAP